MATADLTVSHLREILHYDPATGIFTWLVDIARRTKAGTIAGTATKARYIKIKIYGKTYAAHRLAWFYVRQVWPTGLIDHKNGVRGDCAFDNLREVTHKVNAQNRRKATDFSVSGVLGVSWHRKARRWRATIELGHFDTKEQASKVYIAAKRLLHEGCTI